MPHMGIIERNTQDRFNAHHCSPIAQLVLDLEERGILDRTLVIVASEFSRDAIMEGKPGAKANDTSK